VIPVHSHTIRHLGDAGSWRFKMARSTQKTSLGGALLEANDQPNSDSINEQPVLQKRQLAQITHAVPIKGWTRLKIG